MEPKKANRIEFRSTPQLLAADWPVRLRTAPLAAWLILGVFVAILLIRAPTQRGWLTSALVLLVLFGGPAVFKLANTRIVVSDDEVITWDAWRRKQRAPRSELARIVLVKIAVLGPRFGLSRALLVDSSGKVRLNLQLDAWSEDQLASILRALGLPKEEPDGPIGPWDANRRFPGAASWVLRFWPVVAIVGFAVAFIVLGFVVEALRG